MHIDCWIIWDCYCCPDLLYFDLYLSLFVVTIQSFSLYPPIAFLPFYVNIFNHNANKKRTYYFISLSYKCKRIILYYQLPDSCFITNYYPVQTSYQISSESLTSRDDHLYRHDIWIVKHFLFPATFGFDLKVKIVRVWTLKKL